MSVLSWEMKWLKEEGEGGRGWVRKRTERGRDLKTETEQRTEINIYSIKREMVCLYLVGFDCACACANRIKEKFHLYQLSHRYLQAQPVPPSVCMTCVHQRQREG